VDVPVLITGESGTGKEQSARAIHEYSAREASPFVTMNCAALPASLIQSELFGHEKGAFAGASERRIGSPRIRQVAVRCFLDEIGDLPPEVQANLLRFLEEKKIRRLGSTKPIPVNVRVIAATNTHLEQAVRDGRFREDLYYRLNVLHLRAPALRERKNDVELLAKHFFTKFAAETRTSAKGFSRDASGGHQPLRLARQRAGIDEPGAPGSAVERRAVYHPRRSGAGAALAGAGLRDPGRSPDGGRSRNDPVHLAANPLQYRPRRPGTGRFADDAVPFDGEIRYSAGYLSEYPS
jgi:hypothetical protein